MLIELRRQTARRTELVFHLSPELRAEITFHENFYNRGERSLAQQKLRKKLDPATPPLPIARVTANVNISGLTPADADDVGGVWTALAGGAGLAACSAADRFSKMEGWAIAFDRALKADRSIDREMRQLLWAGLWTVFPKPHRVLARDAQQQPPVATPAFT
jgi:hypothetical protein